MKQRDQKVLEKARDNLLSANIKAWQTAFSKVSILDFSCKPALNETDEKK